MTPPPPGTTSPPKPPRPARARAPKPPNAKSPNAKSPNAGGGPSSVDPRIRARRIEVKRDEGRRRRHRLVALLVVTGLVAAGYGLTVSPALDVDHVRVVGAARTDPAAVAAVSGITRGDPMVHVSIGGAVRRILALPWVRSATVQRRWPGTVLIHVVERTVVAQVPSDGGRWAQVDATGRVLVRPRVAAGAVVHLTGLKAGRPGTTLPASARPALRVAAALGPSLAAQVASIDAAHADITLALHEDGARVRLGPTDAIGVKLGALAAVLASAPRTCPIATIDVLVPSAPVLTRKQGCA